MTFNSNRLHNILGTIEHYAQLRDRLRKQANAAGVKVPRRSTSPKAGSKVIPDHLRDQIADVRHAFSQDLEEDDAAFSGLEKLYNDLNTIIHELERDITRLNLALR